ncbi:MULTISPECIES: elongation factor P 5-aminopentanone reductase [Pontibacillus]|uniref:SDR family oxidoreductase n=1 Tax=Pontibacillus chungwhensis TaxID=265426 RepID=A0ABY8V325_9BACI|nr:MULTISPECIES: SDR family oxidoreductase [Pontibacillus]MCD5322752.1 SDR family oxidoreductase [Pontibacillus sp. HN14]WIG00024.1 SDR family oxidoreductase [Pontibacillus chungwhensis]
MKTCFILGASGGIGQAIAKKLAGSGYGLILHYQTNHEAIDQLCKNLPDGSVLQTVQGDLRQEASVLNMLDQIAFSVDALVVASGTSLVKLFQDVTVNEMNDVLAIHVKSPWLISQKLLPDMIKKRSGHIILISSIWGEVGASCEVVYSSVKGAQDSFVKSLAKEVGRSGVHVNGIRPGFIRTSMNNQLSDEELIDIEEDIPLGRLGEPGDIANTVHFLVGSGASYIQGEIINVNGAWNG